MRSQCCLHMPPFQFMKQTREILCGQLGIGGQPTVILYYQLYMIMKITPYDSELT